MMRRPLHARQIRSDPNSEATEPLYNRALIACRHVQLLDLRLVEHTACRVFIAQPRRRSGICGAPVRYDKNVTSFPNVVQPSIKNGADLHLPADLFFDFPGQTSLWCLTDVDLASGQFPLVPLVVHQQHLAMLNDHALDGYGKTRRAAGRCWGPSRGAMARHQSEPTTMAHPGNAAYAMLA
jgi:hypothetical protein